MGNMSVLETNEQKKAIINFLKSFRIGYHIRKVKSGDSNDAYYYEAQIRYKTLEYLKVLRFSESLRSFCLFWGMSYHEHYLREDNISDVG